MATMKRAGPGIKDGSVAAAAGIRPYKLDPVYESPTAFLAAKGAKYNSSSAQAGDWFIDAITGGVVRYDAVYGAWVGGKNFHIQGSHVAPCATISTGGAPTGADTTITNTSLGFGLPHFVHYNSGANTAQLGPTTVVDANCCDGLQLPTKNGDNLGCQITFGTSMPNMLATTGCPTCYTVGTDPAFFLKCRIGIPDISDYDILFVGFVEPSAYVVTANLTTPAHLVDAYDEKAGFALADAAGAIHTYTSLAAVDVDTTLTTAAWADDAVKTLMVSVSAAGVVTYRLWSGTTEDTSLGTVAFTFADATVVTPCIIAVKGANAADTPPIIEYIQWGHQ